MRIITLPSQHDLGTKVRHIALNTDEIHRVEESTTGKVSIICKKGDHYDVPDHVSWITVVNFIASGEKDLLTCHNVPRDEHGA